MSLVIFIVSVIVVLAAAIVLNLLVARERISFDASMAILVTLISISIVCFSLSLQATPLLRLILIVVALFILLVVFSQCAASGLTSLFWWMGKDTTTAEKEKTKTCPACRTENTLGKTFCIKCGGRLGHFESEKKSNELSKKVNAHRKIAVRKQKGKVCPKCGAENMFGRIFCAKCRKQLIFPTDVIRGLKISRKAATDKKRSKKLP